MRFFIQVLHGSITSSVSTHTQTLGRGLFVFETAKHQVLWYCLNTLYFYFKQTENNMSECSDESHSKWDGKKLQLFTFSSTETKETRVCAHTIVGLPVLTDYLKITQHCNFRGCCKCNQCQTLHGHNVN